MNHVLSEADAEDLTQQVFLKAWQAIGKYRKMASPFVAWLMTISHNLVVDFYRTRKDRAYLEAEVLADDSAPGPERAAEASIEQQRLRKAILQLVVMSSRSSFYVLSRVLSLLKSPLF